MIRLRVLAAALIAVPLVLTGCTMSANLTTSASSVADQAAKALQDQIGTPEPPKLDCGTDAVPLVNGTVVDCVLTDPDTDLEYDTTVTLSEVDGTNFHIDVQVASEANNAPESAPEDATEDPAGLTVPSQDLGDLAAGALEPELGYLPEIHCFPADVPLVVDGFIQCMLTKQDGTKTTALITFTKVDGTDYSINAVVE